MKRKIKRKEHWSKNWTEDIKGWIWINKHNGNQVGIQSGSLKGSKYTTYRITFQRKVGSPIRLIGRKDGYNNKTTAVRILKKWMTNHPFGLERR